MLFSLIYFSLFETNYCLNFELFSKKPYWCLLRLWWLQWLHSFIHFWQWCADFIRKQTPFNTGSWISSVWVFLYASYLLPFIPTILPTPGVQGLMPLQSLLRLRWKNKMMSFRIFLDNQNKGSCRIERHLSRASYHSPCPDIPDSYKDFFFITDHL